MKFQKGHKPTHGFPKGSVPWNKGKKNYLSKETLQKMSIAKLGKMPINLQQLIQLSKDTHSHREKKLGKVAYNKGFKGVYKTSKETKIKQSLAHKGEKSHLWKGGITELNNQVRSCFKYRQWRSDVFTRDNYTCQTCYNRGGRDVNADHYPKMFAEIMKEYNIKSLEDAINCQELWNINNGRTLCITCHKTTETYGRK